MVWAKMTWGCLIVWGLHYKFLLSPPIAMATWAAISLITTPWAVGEPQDSWHHSLGRASCNMEAIARKDSNAIAVPTLPFAAVADFSETVWMRVGVCQLGTAQGVPCCKASPVGIVA